MARMILFVHRTGLEAYEVYRDKADGDENYLGLVLNNINTHDRATMLPVHKKGYLGIVRAAVVKAIQANLKELDTLKSEMILGTERIW